MSAVNVLAVRIVNNPAMFADPFAFEIEYEALSSLQDDLEWRVTYVGSADTDEHDQLLESIFVGPVTAGSFRFTLETNPPDASHIPNDDLLGVTVILLTCSYRGKEFIRVGYYVNIEYMEEELRENPPEVPLFERLHRSILADHPRVTRFAVPFDEPAAAPGLEEAGMDFAMGGDQGAPAAAMDMQVDGTAGALYQQQDGMMAAVAHDNGGGSEQHHHQQRHNSGQQQQQQQHQAYVSPVM